MDTGDSIVNALMEAQSMGFGVEIPFAVSSTAPHLVLPRASPCQVSIDRSSDLSTKSSFALEHTKKDSVAGVKDKPIKKRTWKKPKDKPKRPLSAYNLFFQKEREKIVLAAAPAHIPADVVLGRGPDGQRRRHRKSHGKVGFAALARNIAEKWKNLDNNSRSPFEAKAAIEKKRYKIELEAWNKAQESKKKKLTGSSHASASDYVRFREQQQPPNTARTALADNVTSAPSLMTMKPSPMFVTSAMASESNFSHGSSNDQTSFAYDSTIMNLHECLASVQRTIDFANSALSSPLVFSALPVMVPSSPTVSSRKPNEEIEPLDTSDPDWLGSFHPVDEEEPIESMIDDEDLQAVGSIISTTWEAPPTTTPEDMSGTFYEKLPTFSMSQTEQRICDSSTPSSEESTSISTEDLDSSFDDDFIDFLSEFESEA